MHCSNCSAQILNTFFIPYPALLYTKTTNMAIWGLSSNMGPCKVPALMSILKTKLQKSIFEPLFRKGVFPSFKMQSIENSTLSHRWTYTS